MVRGSALKKRGSAKITTLAVLDKRHCACCAWMSSNVIALISFSLSEDQISYHICPRLLHWYFDSLLTSSISHRSDQLSPETSSKWKKLTWGKPPWGPLDPPNPRIIGWVKFPSFECVKCSRKLTKVELCFFVVNYRKLTILYKFLKVARPHMNQTALVDPNKHMLPYKKLAVSRWLHP